MGDRHRALTGDPTGPPHGPAGVALSADGQMLASGSADGAIRLWETSTGRPLATLQGRTGGVWGVALSADGHLLASGSFDGTVKLWDTNSGICLHTLRSERRYERMDTTGMTGITDAQRAALLALGPSSSTAQPARPTPLPRSRRPGEPASHSSAHRSRPPGVLTAAGSRPRRLAPGKRPARAIWRASVSETPNSRAAPGSVRGALGLVGVGAATLYCEDDMRDNAGAGLKPTTRSGQVSRKFRPSPMELNPRRTNWLADELEQLRQRLAASGQFVTYSPGPNPNPGVERELSRWLP